MDTSVSTLAYVAAWPMGEDGVSKKISAQVGALVRYGKVEVVSFEYPRWLGFIGRVKPLRVLFNQTIYQWRAIRAVRRSDLVYYRYAPQNVLLNLLIILSGRSKKLIVENNSNNRAEYRVRGMKASAFLNILFEGCIYANAAATVALTEELGVYVARVSAGRARVVTITNGYDPRWLVSASPEHQAEWKARLASRFGLSKVAIFVGYPDIWHGIDRIIRLIERNPEWSIVFVGPGIEEHYGDLIASEHRGRFLFAGELDASEIASLYRNVDLAIGSFAMERKGMAEAASLKVREYVFNDLPVVIGHQDAIAKLCPRIQMVDPGAEEALLSPIWERLYCRPIASKELLTWEAQIERIMEAMGKGGPEGIAMW